MAEMSQTQRSARATMQAVLADLQLEGELDWAMELIFDDLSPAQILIELRKRDAYKTRFQAIDLARQAGRNPPTEAEVLEFETGAMGLFRQGGIPASLYDTPAEMAKLIAAGYNLVTLKERIDEGFVRVNRSPEVRDYFRQQFGIDGDAAAALFFFDHEKSLPFLEEAAKVGTLGGTAKRYGINLTRERATRLVQAGINVDSSSTQFADVSKLSSLFTETVTEGQDLTVEQEGLDAVFGTSADAEKTLQDRRKQREATAKGGGEVMLGRSGTGFGSAT